MASVFLSYAQADSAIVTRVYGDLIRARVGEVWCYEIKSEYGADFRTEYAENIKRSDVFILFDSRHARMSQHVSDEVELCLSSPRTKILLCRCDVAGEWCTK